MVSGSDDLARLEMLASALSGRDLRVDHVAAGAPAWTNGTVIFIDAAAPHQTQLRQLCVQSALLAAGSLNPDLVKCLVRRPALARRYLTLEAQRALLALEGVLPPLMRSLIDPAMARRSKAPAESLEIARSRDAIDEPPHLFGAIRARELLAAERRSGGATTAGQHVPRRQQAKPLRELAEDDDRDDAVEDFATSPVGGGGGLGRLLQKMLQMARQVKGGGPPGADAPTHWSRSGSRAGTHAVHSTASAETVDDAVGSGAGILYPEWDVHRQCYRPDWCTVRELDPPSQTHATVAWLEGYGLRKPLARLGMGLTRFHRQPQGDDIDIDAAIEMQVERMSGATPHERVYIESQRHRRDLSVLILLDISGSVCQSGLSGSTVHHQQRSVVAALTTVLHEIGDRVAVYAFSSRGRAAVELIPVKRFGEDLNSLVMSRLHSLIPGAYSRLGAAIRHGTRVLIGRSGTPRKLLVVLSDGLAYDHGYEPAYGAADARQALAEARRDGVGCLCLSVAAGTDIETLRRVFGSAAHATIPSAALIGRVIGPLFRSALRAAEVRRHAA